MHKNGFKQRTRHIEQVLGRFNSSLENSLLLVCNEVKNYSIAHSEADKFKSLITDKSQNIEQKGKEVYKITDYSNWVICSNNIFTIKVESDDRRFFCLELNDCYRGDHKYFVDLSDAMNDSTAVIFYKYLMNIDLTDWIPVNIPMTDLKADMQEASKPLDQRFIDDVKNGEYEVELHNRKIFLDIFYYQFIKWCELNGHKCIINKLNFRKSVEQYLGIKAGRVRIDDDQKIGFNLPEDIFGNK